MKSKAVLIFLAASLLSGCGPSTKTPEPLPTIVLGRDSASPQGPDLGGEGGVVASGVVMPAQEAQLVFTLGGRVKAVHVSVGDQVIAGQALIELEGQEELEAAVSAAQFEVIQAQQALEDLASEAETARVRAMQDIITYEQAVRDAQYTLDNFTIPSNQANLDTVAALNQMKLQLDQARAAFEPYKFRPSTDPTREERKKALDDAQAGYNAAVKRLQFEYDLEVAEAQLTKALHDYEIYQSGPDPAKVRLAEARLDTVRTQLAAAQAALDRLTLKAPFAGTVVGINAYSGEWVIPGQAVLMLADLAHLRIETTDLSERDVPKIEPGQSVTVFIEALNLDLNGRVIEISPLADTLGGDVVYKTTIELDEHPPGLRAGMSVEVEFETAG